MFILYYSQEAQLSQMDGVTRYVSWNLVNCASVRKNVFDKANNRRMALEVTNDHKNGAIQYIIHILLPISGL